MICDCGRTAENTGAMVELCACGRRYINQKADQMTAGSETHRLVKHAGPTFSQVNTNVNTCRQCPSGRYDPGRDACIEVIEIGLAKGRRRAGKINWLHYHPDAKCPLGHF